ncbi:hypothetical protein niasHT_006440 [Heterodera trifolii]|uniref:Uncharacterized protein n=1 Tax=Heterodera trifolii TaxID=157864 RepID=A0ABD2LRZ1_9BILA
MRMSPQPNHSFSAIIQQRTPIPNRGSNRMCSLCEAKGHAPNKCTKYTTPGARRKRLADQERCINCLVLGHTSQNCTSPRRCSHCGEKHHFMVCYGDEKQRNIPPQIQRNNFYGRGTESSPNQFTQGHERPDNRNDSVGMMSPQINRSFLTLTSPQFSQREIGQGQGKLVPFVVLWDILQVDVPNIAHQEHAEGGSQNSKSVSTAL